MNIYNLLKHTLCWAFAVALLTSCKKDKVNIDAIEPNTPVLAINFTSGTININQVDSVVVQFAATGKAGITQKAVKHTGNYQTPLSNLPAGDWKALVKVYAKSNDVNPVQRMYRQESTVTQQGSLNLTAPKGTLYDTWKPALVKYNAQYNIKLVMAEQPTDAYYELTLPTGLPSTHIYFDRYLYNVVDGVGHIQGYQGYQFAVADHINRHTNPNAFNTFSASVANKVWTMADFSLYLFNESGQGDFIEVFYEQIEKRP